MKIVLTVASAWIDSPVSEEYAVADISISFQFTKIIVAKFSGICL